MVAPVSTAEILALAPELALNQKVIMGDNGLEALVEEYEILPYEVREAVKEFDVNKTTQRQRLMMYSEAGNFVEKFVKYEKLDWGLPIYSGSETRYTQLPSLKEIGRYLNRTANIALEKGDRNFAKTLIFASRRLAKRLDTSSNTQMSFLVSVSISNNSEKLITEMVYSNNFTDANLRDLLANYEADVEPVGFELGLRGVWEEYAYAVATVRFPQDALSTVFSGGDGDGSPKQLEGFRGNKNPFDRIATAKVGAEYFRAIFENHDFKKANAIYEKLQSTLSHLTESSEESPEYKKWLRETPNSFGILLNLMYLPTLTENATDAQKQMVVYRDLNRLLIACKLFELQEGRLPHTLSELKIKNGTIDALSGKPLRYDPKRGVIWSVGKDKIDNNGIETAYEMNTPPNDAQGRIQGKPETVIRYRSEDMLVKLK